MDIVLSIEETRKAMKADRRTIKVNDLGAGSSSATLKGDWRKVSDVARHSSIPPKYGKLLFNLAAEFGGKYIVELGTSLGISTLYLAAGSPHSEVHTIEGCSNTLSVATENFKKLGFTNIREYSNSFDDGLKKIESDIPSAGLVFIDGDHRREALNKYLDSVIKIVGDKGVVVIDDIHVNREMTRAWKDILQDDRVTTSIDIYRMGIIFFRKGLTRSNYVIRY